MSKTAFENRRVLMSEIIVDGEWPAPIRLLNNMRSVGLTYPIILVEQNGKLYLHDGRSRHACARELGWTSIEARVFQASPLLTGDMLTMSANIRGGNPLSEAVALGRLSECMSEEDLLLYSGMAKSTRDKRMSLLKLHESIQKLVETGELKITAGYELAKLHEYKDQLAALDNAKRMSIKRRPTVPNIQYAVASEMHRRNPTLPLPPPIVFDDGGNVVTQAVLVEALRRWAAVMPQHRAIKLEEAAQEIERGIG